MEGKTKLRFGADAGQEPDALVTARSQLGALCYRFRRGRPEILLITSRDTGRWIIPKGWPMDGMTPGQSAAAEAWEEAGVTGRVEEHCLGIYPYFKTTGPKSGFDCMVAVYPIEVTALRDDYPEKGQRKRKWLPPRKAAAKVSEPELAALLSTVDLAAIEA